MPFVLLKKSYLTAEFAKQAGLMDLDFFNITN
jgi:hypothetical protein